MSNLYYLGDPEEIRKAQEAVAKQGKGLIRKIWLTSRQA
jgi:hypothetical protein